MYHRGVGARARSALQHGVRVEPQPPLAEAQPARPRLRRRRMRDRPMMAQEAVEAVHPALHPAVLAAALRGAAYSVASLRPLFDVLETGILLFSPSRRVLL